MDVAAEKVLSNDNLLMKILVWLRPKYVLRCRCVSNRWNNLIQDPFFLQSYRECGGGGHLAFVNGTTKLVSYGEMCRIADPYMAKTLPVYGIDYRSNLFNNIPTSLGYFINSCNGLILCGHHPMNYHVLNTLTRKWDSLPLPLRRHEYPSISIGLVCDENTSELVADYRVVRAGIRHFRALDNTLHIQTFSSKTCQWVESTLLGTENFSLERSKPPVVLNGVFHWYTSQRAIAVYDPKDVGGGEKHVQLIQPPLPGVGGITSSFTRSSSNELDDVLWFGIHVTTDSMKIWMLPKGENGSYRRCTTIPNNEWVLMYTINIDLLRVDCAILVGDELMRKNSKPGNCWFSFEAFIPWNPPVAVVRLEEKLFLYNLDRKSVELI